MPIFDSALHRTTAPNVLYYGDNLEILRTQIPDESVDLIYLDPPFNSQRTYNVLFKQHKDDGAQAQIEAFDDTWHWGPEAERAYHALINGDNEKMADTAVALFSLLGKSDMLAYLVMMAPRLIEMHRVLKTTGSLYLHCDPTASHYLKILLDATFGPMFFRNEVIWKRTTAHSSSKKFAPVHDVLLYYAKGKKPIWTGPRTEYEQVYLDKYYRFDDGDGRLYWRADLTGAGTRQGDTGQPWRGFDPTPKGRHWMVPPSDLDELDSQGRIYWPSGGSGWPQHKRYREDLKGAAVADLWTDIDRINPVGAERLGYPTQKPLALLERIIEASSNPGDVVLDPFCGCGTSVDASQKLGRNWIGIDITWLAIDIIENRLVKQHGQAIRSSYEVVGIPRDLGSAYSLFSRDPFDFERWAVSLVDAQPHARHSQIGDKGIDGTARFMTGPDTFGKILVSVKGGKQLNPSMVRDLTGTVENHRAAMGVFIALSKPTKGMIEAANTSGLYTHPTSGQTYPRVQIITVEELLDGKRPERPATLMPYDIPEKMEEDRVPAQSTGPDVETKSKRSASAS